MVLYLFSFVPPQNNYCMLEQFINKHHGIGLEKFYEHFGA